MYRGYAQALLQWCATQESQMSLLLAPPFSFLTSSWSPPHHLLQFQDQLLGRAAIVEKQLQDQRVHYCPSLVVFCQWNLYLLHRSFWLSFSFHVHSLHPLQMLLSHHLPQFAQVPHPSIIARAILISQPWTHQLDISWRNQLPSFQLCPRRRQQSSKVQSLLHSHRRTILAHVHLLLDFTQQEVHLYALRHR